MRVCNSNYAGSVPHWYVYGLLVSIVWIPSPVIVVQFTELLCVTVGRAV